MSASNAGDLGSIPGSGRSPGEGSGNPLQYSCLENPMDGGAWWATVRGVANAGSYVSSTPSFLRNRIFRSGCISLLSHLRCKSIPFSPNPLQHLLCRLFDDGHSDQCEVICHCSFDLHFLEKAMAPHSSTLAWKIPWAEEPGRLQSMGSLRVRHD